MADLIIPKKKTQIHRDFFNRDALNVAYDLLGRVMVQERKNKPSLYVQLTEVAAYDGIVGNDLAVAQKKNSNLFYAPGIIGISTSYGKHLIDIGTKRLCEPSCITLIAGNLFDKRGLRERLQGPGNLSKALEIDSEYDSSPIDFSQLWIGGEPVNKENIKQRKKSNAPKNCKGYFYFRN